MVVAVIWCMARCWDPVPVIFCFAVHHVVLSCCVAAGFGGRVCINLVAYGMRCVHVCAVWLHHTVCASHVLLQGPGGEPAAVESGRDAEEAEMELRADFSSLLEPAGLQGFGLEGLRGDVQLSQQVGGGRCWG